MMDQGMVNQAISYHGPELVDQLAREQVDVELPSFLALPNKAMKQELCKNPEFETRLVTFIARKADLLFQQHDKKPVKPLLEDDDEVSDLYAIVPPLEAYQEAPENLLRQHFYKSVEEGDIVIGRVTSIQEAGLVVTLTCTDCDLTRQVDNLNIQASCLLRELPQFFPHESPLKSFNMKDLVRTVVIGVMKSSEKLAVSMMPSALPSDKKNVKLGPITEDDLPIHYCRLRRMDSATYGEHLQRRLGFSNPSNVQYLCRMLGISDDPPASLMRDLGQVSYPKSEYADKLRKQQSYKWSLKSVAEGISHFKEGRHVEAMQLLNRALDIDTENVEALVARGAMYANKESYSRALEDFECALKLNPNHPNAKKYTCETLVAYARSLLDSGEEEAAREHLEHALEIDPTMEEAHRTLRRLQAKPLTAKKDSVIEIPSDEDEVDKTGRVRHDSRSQTEPESSLEKTSETLRKLIEEEKSNKLKKSKTRRSGEYSDDYDQDDNILLSSNDKRRPKSESEEIIVKRSRHSSKEDPTRDRVYNARGDQERYSSSHRPQDRHRESEDLYDKGVRSPILDRRRSIDNYSSRKGRSDRLSLVEVDRVKYSPEKHREDRESHLRAQYIEDDDRHRHRNRHNRNRSSESSSSTSSSSSSSSTSGSSSYDSRSGRKQHKKRIKAHNHHRSFSRRSSLSPESSSSSRRRVSVERFDVDQKVQEAGNRRNISVSNLRIAEQIREEQNRISLDQNRTKGHNKNLRDPVSPGKETKQWEEPGSLPSSSAQRSQRSHSPRSDQPYAGQAALSPKCRPPKQHSDSPEWRPLKDYQRVHQSTYTKGSDSRRSVSYSQGSLGKRFPSEDQRRSAPISPQSDKPRLATSLQPKALSDEYKEKPTGSSSAQKYKTGNTEDIGGSPQEFRTVSLVASLSKPSYAIEVEGTLKNGGWVSGTHGDIDYRPQAPPGLIPREGYDRSRNRSGDGPPDPQEWNKVGTERGTSWQPEVDSPSRVITHPNHDPRALKSKTVPEEKVRQKNPSQSQAQHDSKRLTRIGVENPERRNKTKPDSGEENQEKFKYRQNARGSKGRQSEEYDIGHQGKPYGDSRPDKRRYLEPRSTKYDHHPQPRKRSRRCREESSSESSSRSCSSSSSLRSSSLERRNSKERTETKEKRVTSKEIKEVDKPVQGQDLRLGANRLKSLVGYDDEEESKKIKSSKNIKDKGPGNPDAVGSKPEDGTPAKTTKSQDKLRKNKSDSKVLKKSGKPETVEQLQFGKWDSPSEMAKKKEANEEKKSAESLAEMEKFLFMLKQKKKESQTSSETIGKSTSYKRW